jgi:hypothetical protein
MLSLTALYVSLILFSDLHISSPLISAPHCSLSRCTLTDSVRTTSPPFPITHSSNSLVLRQYSELTFNLRKPNVSCTLFKLFSVIRNSCTFACPYQHTLRSDACSLKKWKWKRPHNVQTDIRSVTKTSTSKKRLSKGCEPVSLSVCVFLLTEFLEWYFCECNIYISTGTLGRLHIALRMEGKLLTECVLFKQWHFFYSPHKDGTGLHKSLAPGSHREYILHGSA